MYRPHERHGLLCGPSKTKQSMKAECDINNIMAKYQKSGLVTHVNERQGTYDDFISAPDYHTAMNQICAANESFESLPSGIRNRFHNDPALFLEFVQDPAHQDELVRMGLADPKPEKTPTEPVQAPKAKSGTRDPGDPSGSPSAS